MVAAVQLPRVRDDLVGLCSSDLVGQLLATHLLRGGQVDLPMPEAGMTDDFGGAVEAYQRRLANLAGVASLFHVSAEMTAVADSARRSMPGYRLHPDDLPAERGLVVFDAPIGVMDEGSEMLSDLDREMIERAREAGEEVPPVEVVGALWGPAFTRENEPGVLVVFWTDSSSTAAYHERRGELEDAATVRGLGALGYNDETVLPFGDVYDEAAGEDEPIRNAAIGTLICTWLLMGQEIVSSDEVSLPRQLRRRLEREGRSVPAVRVVRLRHAKRSPSESEGSGREYRHRWVVQGHWRNQYYPSQDRHRPIYIPAYVKGPEGAPLIGAEKVYDLRK